MKNKPWLDDTIAANGEAVSKNFADWFGASKVKNEDGSPMVVFHGTYPWEREDGSSLGNITSFNRLASVQIVRRPATIDTVGSWFSSNASEDGAAKYGSTIYPVYLSIQVPHETTFALMLRRARLLANGNDDGRMVREAEVNAYRKWLADIGKDGIKIVHDGGTDSNEFEKQDAWIALEPTQIKSALGNAGLYLRGSSDLCDTEAARKLELAREAQRLIVAPRALREVSP